VSAATISRYESGEITVGLERVTPLANALEMSVNELMGWPEYTPPEPDDYDRLCDALRKLGVIRVDGSVDFERFADVERRLKARDRLVGEGDQLVDNASIG
jgi:transcriptional regulator with XRE-family HTH domain